MNLLDTLIEARDRIQTLIDALGGLENLPARRTTFANNETPKRRGRPPGSKNRPSETSNPTAQAKRKGWSPERRARQAEMMKKSWKRRTRG